MILRYSRRFFLLSFVASICFVCIFVLSAFELCFGGFGSF